MHYSRYEHMADLFIGIIIFFWLSITFQIISNALHTFLTAGDQWQYFHRKFFQVAFSLIIVSLEHITIGEIEIFFYRACSLII